VCHSQYVQGEPSVGVKYVVVLNMVLVLCAGIFSPIDPNLVTPLTRNRPIATVAMPSSTTMDTTTYTYHPIHAPASEVTMATTLNQPLSVLTSSSTPITTKPAFSCVTPNTNATPPLSSSTETSGLFSPLESSSASKYASSRQPVASPLLIAHTKGGSGEGLGRGSYPRVTGNDVVPARSGGASKRNEGQLYRHQDDRAEVSGVSSDEGGTVSGSDAESATSSSGVRLPEPLPPATVTTPSSGGVALTNHAHHHASAGSASVDYPDSTGAMEVINIRGSNASSVVSHRMPSTVGSDWTYLLVGGERSLVSLFFSFWFMT